MFDEELNYLINWIDKVGGLLEKTNEIDQYQVYGAYRNTFLTRFANSEIPQNVLTSTLHLKVEVAKGKKEATFTFTPSEDMNLKEFIDKEIAKLKLYQPIDFFQGYADHGKKLETIPLTGMLMNAEQRAEMVKRAVGASLELTKNVGLAGKMESTHVEVAIKNSNGIEGKQVFLYNEFKVTAITEKNGKKGYARKKFASREPKEFDPEGLARSATEMSLQTLDAKKIDPGTWTVLLKPEAVEELMTYLLYVMNADSVHKGQSPYSNKFGKQVLDDKWTIFDHPRDPNTLLPAAFDGEGVIKRDLPLFEKGKPVQPLYSITLASKYLNDKNKATGVVMHHLTDYFFGGAFPTNIVFKDRNATVDEMISEVKEGLLVNTFWYMNYVDQREGILTALTRDGLFYIKNGEIQHAVKNLRMTDSIFNFLKSVPMISKEEHKSTLGLLPHLLLEKLKFTGQAKH